MPDLVNMAPRFRPALDAGFVPAAPFSVPRTSGRQRRPIPVMPVVWWAENVMWALTPGGGVYIST
jgi:hypothetical protein